MLNVTRWMKDNFEFPEGGKDLIEKVIETFKNDGGIVERSTIGVTFKNGSRMVIKMASEAVKEAVEEK